MYLKGIQDEYLEKGFCFPIDVMSAAQAASYNVQLQDFRKELKRRDRKFGHGVQLNHLHLVACFAKDIALNDRILDAVEAIIGPDILLWSSAFFVKEPCSQKFVSLHQDLRYWGLADSDAMVSAWLARTPVNRANGCMRFVLGSHRTGLVEHEDRFDEDNILYRGQRAQVDINESDMAYVELEPGQMSLHHGYMLHSSDANPSDNYRIGYTMSFIAPSNRQLVADEDYAVLVRGQDSFGHFRRAEFPDSDFSDSAIEWHARVLAARDLATHKGLTTA